MKDTDQLIDRAFYEQLDVLTTDEAFSGYSMSYKVQIDERKDPIVQLKASRLGIKNLFDGILNETKGLKYQITVKALLKKYKLDGEIEFKPVYLYLVTKAITNH